MNNLPEAFTKRLKEQLGPEFDAYLKCFEKRAERGIRFNSLKSGWMTSVMQAPFSMEPVPWTENGYFYPDGTRPTEHPSYRGGAFYVQEPSAMTPAELLPVEPGQRVLDLCAAPGGKATRLGEKLRGEGLLVANEVSRSRAKALLRNIELFGITNALVTNELPLDLENRFPQYFDRILTDVPCSGEGMFRRDEEAVRAWSEEKVLHLAKLQKGILCSAYRMLKPGGLLMYSTCTFSPQENEENIAWFLKEYPDMRIEELPHFDGFSSGEPAWGGGDENLRKTVRLWPHKLRGEGHFLALLKKEGQKQEEPAKCRKKKKTENGRREIITQSERKLAEQFCASLAQKGLTLEKRAGKAFLVPQLPQSAYGVSFLRSGIYIGDFKKDRFEPSQQLSYALDPKDYPYRISLAAEDKRTAQYFSGEDLLFEFAENIPDKAWVLLCAEGIPLGWGKRSGTKLKNKYLCSFH